MDLTKAQLKKLRVLASLAHEREISRELSALEKGFVAWRRGEMDAFALGEAIHRFHDGPSRHLYGMYAYCNTELLVLRALDEGILREDEIPAELRQKFQDAGNALDGFLGPPPGSEAAAGESGAAREVREKGKHDVSLRPRRDGKERPAPASSSASTRQPARRKARGGGRGPKTVLQLKVTLLGVDPPIWRRIRIAGDSTFWDLHVAIQDAMGWTDTHLHLFEIVDPVSSARVRIGIPDEDDEEEVLAGWESRVADFLREGGESVRYEYDFGDCWRHSVLLEQVAPAEPGGRYPRCLDGARRCPPEDCGGTSGYEAFLEAIRDPGHPDHEEKLVWIGGPFDPEDFSPDAVRFTNAARRLRDLLDGSPDGFE